MMGGWAVSGYTISLADILAAADRVRGIIHRTPVLTCSTIHQLAHRSVMFKCENLQKTGSFKYRGATNAVRRLGANPAAAGVVTHSSGNHAQALALAARECGIPATVVMPKTASPIKQAAVRGYGGAVILCEPTLEARDRAAAEAVARTGGTLIPPFDHPDIIAGQGTAAIELLEEYPRLDAVIAPVGGGGLLSGVAIAATSLRPSLRVFGAEPLGADDAARSKAAGHWLPQTGPRTIADGLLTSLGQLTWPIVRDRVEAILTVSEEEIRAAMRLIWERMKLVIEPSAAVAVAAVLSESFQKLSNIQSVGIILSGGNVAFPFPDGSDGP
ncbi:MAG: pyridoxal-phosphate dependent enzyme [Bacteroidales bacterium]|nr:pyridoxal-phosphate dependent enzyme [Bacteroidales bacterium]